MGCMSEYITEQVVNSCTYHTYIYVTRLFHIIIKDCEINSPHRDCSGSHTLSHRLTGSWIIEIQGLGVQQSGNDDSQLTKFVS